MTAESSVPRATDTITVLEGFDAMRVFLEVIWQRQDRTSHEIAFVLGRSRWADGSPADPTIWKDLACGNSNVAPRPRGARYCQPLRIGRTLPLPLKCRTAIACRLRAPRSVLVSPGSTELRPHRRLRKSWVNGMCLIHGWSVARRLR